MSSLGNPFGVLRTDGAGEGCQAHTTRSSWAPVGGGTDTPPAAGQTQEVTEYLWTLTSSSGSLNGRLHQSPAPRNDTEGCFCV